jgi:UDPglucose 6-dehydrogenase
MKISIIGTGYVGLVNGACLSELGHDVTCIDINKEKINYLNNGIISIYEQGLDNIVRRNKELNRLHFSVDYSSIKDSDLVYVAVGTPCIKGSIGVDMQYVESAVKSIAYNIEKDIIVVMKSTVPVGTSKKVRNIISNILKERDIDSKVWFDIISNPEFLKEGDAINDFFHPDRIVVGAENEYTINIMKSLYGDNILVTNIASSEMIKYASNAMLATRISFMNELANLCEAYGANVDEVKVGMGLDSRIGSKFLNAGCGYGGSCFPKDVNGFLQMGNINNIELNVVNAVKKANEKQKHIILKKLESLNDYVVDNKTISILGLSFKPETDDMREAPSLTIINDIKSNFKNVNIKVYDPIAMDNCKKILNDNVIYYSKNMIDCLSCSDIVILVTEWDEFKNINWREVSKIINKNALVIDGRNIFNGKDIINNGLNYLRIG